MSQDLCLEPAVLISDQLVSDWGRARGCGDDTDPHLSSACTSVLSHLSFPAVLQSDMDAWILQAILCNEHEKSFTSFSCFKLKLAVLTGFVFFLTNAAKSLVSHLMT